MTNSKILISAAGGKVGQHVLAQLAAKNIPARAGVHSEDKAAALRKTGVDAVVLDFESQASISAAFNGIEKLFLVTPGSPDQGRYETNLLAEAKKVGVKHLVKLSGKIDEADTVGFSVWNTAAEKRIKESGIPYTIVRGNFFMQNLLGNAPQIKQGAFTAGPAAKRIALIDTRDMAAAVVAALTEEGHAGKTYDLNGPELLDGYAQAAAFSKALGRPVKYLDVTAEAFIEKLKSFGLPPWMVEAFGAAVSSPTIPGDQSSATIERILHRKPGTLEQFVKDHRAAFEVSR